MTTVVEEVVDKSGSEIILCDACGGSGEVLVRTTTYDEIRNCDKCGGSGRLVRTVTITTRPFKN